MTTVDLIQLLERAHLAITKGTVTHGNPDDLELTRWASLTAADLKGAVAWFKQKEAA